jgi:hypothetical protein
MRLFAAALVLGLAASARAEPVNVKAMVGCWDVSNRFVKAELVVTPDRVVGRFDDAMRGKTTLASAPVPVRATGELEVTCRPVSQHGSFCRLKPEGKGLRVRVYAFSYNNHTQGRLVESFTARRCRR